MAKIKVVNNNLDQNLLGGNFNNTASQTIFSFGAFSVTSNFDGRTFIDYENKLTTFINSVTLETLNLNESQSEIFYKNNNNAVLNLDNTNLGTFVKFGSAFEFLRISIENIIVNYPSSLYVNSKSILSGNITFFELDYNELQDVSYFKIPSQYIENKYNLIFDYGNLSVIDNNKIKNLNLSYNKYQIWVNDNPNNNINTIIGFTGDTTSHQYINVKVIGNPFSGITGTSGRIDFHIKPQNTVFEEFRQKLRPYERYIVSEKDELNGFKFILKNPILLEDGNITYVDSEMLWHTSDGYNLEIDTVRYQKFLDIILTIAQKYDKIKTDLIARFLVPQSIKIYDLTEENKITKLLRIYGKEFDEIRQFVDSIVDINKITYNKITNIPDQLISNFARTLGWEYFSLINEEDLVKDFFTIDDNERNLKTDLMPSEIDIELWRRILLNTNYFWKSKGTRHAIKSMFLLIGIPEPFINITEYVYTVEGRIDPRNVPISINDFPTNSLPYDEDGYPKAPLETNDFYFQMSGNSDSGQAYLDVFRLGGFNLFTTVDNKKSWVQTGSTIREHNTTPQYYQEDSKLVINTKEIDVTLDIARGIEYDVYRYIKDIDFPANSSGFTLPYSYINLSLNVASPSGNTFTLPPQFSEAEGDIEVRFNGILLNAPKEYDSGGTYIELTQNDYVINGDVITLSNVYAIKSGNVRDVLSVTYIYSGNTAVSGVTVKYVVLRVNASLFGTTIQLPEPVKGDVQLTINGIALTKGTNQYIADYIVNPSNPSQIIIQNSQVISYLVTNPYVQVAFLTVTGSTTIESRSEIHRVDSFNSSKFYFNALANRYVYKLNYKINNTRNVKILINGIGLEPQTDYVVNSNNNFEIFLPNTIGLGSVISAYYLIGGEDLYNPIVLSSFSIGDISNLSFLEFIDLLERKLINVKNRKIITDGYGGWYPTLLKIYITYIKRSFLPNDDPLHSNGYTFRNLYSFLNKYNSFFKNFVDQLLPATIILKKSGLLVRNTIFNKQKFTYKRGVNFDEQFKYLGDDGSMFIRKVDDPISFALNTIEGSPSIYSIDNTGGFNISLFEGVISYGIQYRILGSEIWENQPIPFYTIPLSANTFNHNLIDLFPDTTYEYRAFVTADNENYTYGNILTGTTELEPYLETIEGS